MKKPRQLTPPPSRPRPVFRRPKQIARQHHKDSTSPSSFDEVGSSQGKLRRYVPVFELGSPSDTLQVNPVVLEDESPVADNSGALIKATSGEPEIGAAPLLSTHPMEESKTPGCVDAPTDPDPPTDPLDRPPFPDVARPQHRSGRVVREDDYGAPPVAGPPSATTLPLSQQPQGEVHLATDTEDDEWEIVKIVGKRRTKRGDEYKVR